MIEIRRAAAAVILAAVLTGTACAETAGTGAGDTGAAGKTVSWAFDDVAVGSLPEGFKIEGTHQQGPLATWQVVEEGGGRALELTRSEHGHDGVFNLCWTEGVKFTDGEIEVRLRANRGEVDRGGGVIWRAQSPNRYYIARWNPLENNLRVYYVDFGERKQLKSVSLDVATDQWHTLRIRHVGSNIQAFIDGEKVIDFVDARFATAGGVGLWTKADAETSFDDLKVSAIR